MARCRRWSMTGSSSSSRQRSFNTWSIVFSHPEDFAPQDLETDRWVVLLGQAFQDSEVRPLELRPSDSRSNFSWVCAVNDDMCIEGSQEVFDANWNALALQAQLLCRNIEPRGGRFVAILDGQLRVRRTFKYFRGSSVPSPLEILGWTVALRSR